MKLSVKLPLALGLVTISLGALLGLWVHLTMSSVTDANARASALGQLQAATRAYEATGDLPPFAALDSPDLPGPLRDAVSRGAAATYLDAPQQLSWAATPGPDGKPVSVRESWADGLAQLAALDTRLGLGVAGVALVGIGFAAALAWALSRRLGRAQRDALAIADGDLSVRVAHGVGGRDEVASLARTIDVLTARMQERIESEKRVTADIAHDLRTPVTGLVTAASLLPPGRPTEIVQSQVQRLWRLVEDLLEVARLDEHRQDVDLQPTETVTLARRGIEASGIDGVELLVEESATVPTDPRRVERVIVNLIANAARHGAAPIVCRVDGPRISVSDHGAGFPSDLIEHGPRRFRTGASERGTGHGLGLTIAAGQARVLGAHLEFTNLPTGGACATLTLPQS